MKHHVGASLGAYVSVLHHQPTRYADWESASLLGETERQYARSLSSTAAKCRFTQSHSCLKQLLADATETSPQEWQLVKDARGCWKCAQSNTLPKMYFSLSHSHQVTAIALSREAPIGIDIELQAHKIYPEQVAAAFHVNELKSLSKFSVIDQPTQTLKLWTAKEAYTKLTGLGPFLEPSTFEISVDPLRIKIPSSQNKIGFDSTELFLNGHSYRLTVAATKSKMRGDYV
ncbi:MAG: 4'-phosphopantetheinyl transferase superfamily protein [Deltaproteobacteria bacterium]|nr:4'-phosphopantetheinyl transferase superfamily protein [Deltaproteobacteria bacterium]